MKHTPSNGIEVKVPFKETFYDGAIDIVNSVCEIPDDKFLWARRLEGLGFKYTDEKQFRQARGLLSEETVQTEPSKMPRQPR